MIEFVIALESFAPLDLLILAKKKQRISNALRPPLEWRKIFPFLRFSCEIPTRFL